MAGESVLRNRVVPILLARNGGLVKTRQFQNPVYVGDPINAIRIFNEKEVDELALLDISATPASGPNFELVEDVASECFMPLAYGGGVRHVDDAARLFSLGVEKVVVRTAAASNLQVISEIADAFGRQSVAVSVDVNKGRLGGRKVHAPGTARHGASDWLGFVKEAVSAGAGEIVLTSVDREGTMEGMDLAAIEMARDIGVPLLPVGGVGKLEDIGEAIAAGAHAVGVGSFFVFHGPRRAVLITYPSQAELASVQGA
jgi:cyclase